MKLALEASEIYGTVNGIPARLWRGHTESGIEVYTWIVFLRAAHVYDGDDLAREIDAMIASSTTAPIAIAIDRIRQDP